MQWELFCPCGPVERHPLVHLCQGLDALSLHAQGPATEYLAVGHAVGKPVRRRQGDQLLGAFGDFLYVPTAVRERCSPVEDTRQVKGLCLLLSEAQGLVTALPGLLWIAKTP